jgi:hypothetical protein
MCEKSGTVIGLSPSTPGGLADQLKPYLKAHLPFLTEPKLFKDSDAMEDYMAAKEYKNVDNKGLCMGISFTNEINGKYEYSMRFNFSGGRWNFYEYPTTENDRILLESRSNLEVFE